MKKILRDLGKLAAEAAPVVRMNRDESNDAIIAKKCQYCGEMSMLPENDDPKHLVCWNIMCTHTKKE